MAQIMITWLRHTVHIHTATKVQNCLMSLSRQFLKQLLLFLN